jgi:hypothetical protein
MFGPLANYALYTILENRAAERVMQRVTVAGFDRSGR